MPKVNTGDETFLSAVLIIAVGHTRVDEEVA
jgi:hypothetical protein